MCLDGICSFFSGSHAKIVESGCETQATGSDQRLVILVPEAAILLVCASSAPGIEAQSRRIAGSGNEIKAQGPGALSICLNWPARRGFSRKNSSVSRFVLSNQSIDNALIISFPGG